MSSKYVAVICSRDLGYLIPKKKAAITISGTDYNDTARKMYATASKERVKAVFVVPINQHGTPHYIEIKSLVNALQDAGYEDIKTLNDWAFIFSMALTHSKFVVKPDEYICFFVTPFGADEGNGFVYTTTPDGHCYNLDDLKINNLSFLSRYDFIKYVIIITGDVFSDFTEALRDNGKRIYVEQKPIAETVGSFDWFGFADDPVLPIAFRDIFLHFYYGNEVHHVNVAHLPFTETQCHLTSNDIETLTLTVNYLNTTFETVQVLQTGHLSNITEKRFRVTIIVPETALPRFHYEVIEEKILLSPHVYVIDYNMKTNLVSGKILEKTGITKSIPDSIITDRCAEKVLNSLKTAYPSPDLRGIVVNYWETDELPLANHKALAIAIATMKPTPPLIIGKTHGYYSLHLSNSKVDVKQNEYVALVNWSNFSPKVFALFQKKNNFFHMIRETVALPKKSSKLVVVVENEPTVDEIKEAKQSYPNKQLFFSSRSKVTCKRMLEYSWEYFNGGNFDHYMAKSRNYYLLYKNFSIHLKPSTTCNCQEYTFNNIIDIGIEDESLMSDFFSQSPHMYIKYAGYEMPSLFAQITKPNAKYIHLETVVDKNMIPIGKISTIDKSNQLVPLISEKPQDVSVVFFTTKLPGFYALFAITDDLNSVVVNSYDEVITNIHTLLPLVKASGFIDLNGNIHTMSQRLKYRKELQCINHCIFSHSFNFGTMLLYKNKVQVNINESIILLLGMDTVVLTKHENSFKCVYIAPDGCMPNLTTTEIASFYKKYNVVSIIIIDKSAFNSFPKLPSPKFLDLSETGEFSHEIRLKFVNSLLNGTNFDGYLIDDFDQIHFEAEWDDKIIVVHSGIENLPFEVTKELDIGETSALKVFAKVKYERYLVKHFTMKTKKHRRVSLIMKQLNMCDILASLVVLEPTSADNEKVKESVKTTAEVKSNEPLPRTTPQPSEELQSAEKPTSDNAPRTLPPISFTFTANNRILIDARVDYTGKSELAAYFRMECGKFGPVVTIGEKAKKAYKKHPKTVIYDIPGLLAANTDPSNDNPTWSFETSRTDDGTLLIHLGKDAFTSPIPLFAAVLQSALLYAKEHMTETIEAIGIKVPEFAIISEDDLAQISIKLGVSLTRL